MRVMIADDSVLFREGLSRILTEAGLDIVGAFPDGTLLQAAIETDPPEVAVLDVRMPPTFTDEGLRAAIAIRSAHPTVGVLVLSQHVETNNAGDLLAGGAGGVGYLLKDRVLHINEFVEAVRRVGSGGNAIDPEVVGTLLARHRQRGALDPLSPRQRDVLASMAEGRTNRAIAEALFVGDKTVESHVASIFTKRGLLPAPDGHRRVLAVLTYLRS